LGCQKLDFGQTYQDIQDHFHSWLQFSQLSGQYLPELSYFVEISNLCQEQPQELFPSVSVFRAPAAPGHTPPARAAWPHSPGKCPSPASAGSSGWTAMQEPPAWAAVGRDQQWVHRPLQAVGVTVGVIHLAASAVEAAAVGSLLASLVMQAEVHAVAAALQAVAAALQAVAAALQAVVVAAVQVVVAALQAVAAVRVVVAVEVVAAAVQVVAAAVQVVAAAVQAVAAAVQAVVDVVAPAVGSLLVAVAQTQAALLQVATVAAVDEVRPAATEHRPQAVVAVGTLRAAVAAVAAFAVDFQPVAVAKLAATELPPAPEAPEDSLQVVAVVAEPLLLAVEAEPLLLAVEAEPLLLAAAEAAARAVVVVVSQHPAAAVFVVLHLAHSLPCLFPDALSVQQVSLSVEK